MRLQVIKNGSRYYSSYLDKKQYVYAFDKKAPLVKCTNFLNEYKKLYSRYPPADNSHLLLTTRDDESDFIYTESEDADEFHRLCTMYNAGLAVVESFDYKFVNTHYTVDVSASEVMSDVNWNERINLLNYILIVHGDDDSK